MSTFRPYLKNKPQMLRPWIPEDGDAEAMNAKGISVWEGDVPEAGGMIAQNADNPHDVWYVAKSFFEANYVPAWVSVGGRSVT